MNHISDLKVANAIQVINFLELPGIKHVMSLANPYIAYNQKIYIDPAVMPITIEILNKGIADGTINKALN